MSHAGPAEGRSAKRHRKPRETRISGGRAIVAPGIVVDAIVIALRAGVKPRGRDKARGKHQHRAKAKAKAKTGIATATVIAIAGVTGTAVRGLQEAGITRRPGRSGQSAPRDRNGMPPAPHGTSPGPREPRAQSDRSAGPGQSARSGQKAGRSAHPARHGRPGQTVGRARNAQIVDLGRNALINRNRWKKEIWRPLWMMN